MADNTIVEVGRVPNNLGSPERVSLYPNLKFEPGNHGDADHTENAALKVLNGDLNSHTWNSEVATRIREYHPQLLAIDGMMAGVDYKSAPMSYILWATLPDRPSAINPTGKVLVIAGDQARFADQVKHKGNFEVAINLLKGQNQDFHSANFQDETKFLLYGSVIGEILALATLPRLSSKRLDRRTLLKIIGGGATLVAGTKVLNEERVNTIFRATEAKTESDKDWNLTLADIVGPKFIKNDWVRARTAMLLLKTKDVIDTLGLPKETAASLLLGNGHSYEAREFLNSDEACQKEIQNYFNKIQEILKKGFREGYASLGLPFMARDLYTENVQLLVNYIAKTDVLEVADPQTVPPSQEIGDVLTQNINPKVSFQSRRVLEALTIQPYNL